MDSTAASMMWAGDSFSYTGEVFRFGTMSLSFCFASLDYCVISILLLNPAFFEVSIRKLILFIAAVLFTQCCPKLLLKSCSLGQKISKTDWC